MAILQFTALKEVLPSAVEEVDDRFIYDTQFLHDFLDLHKCLLFKPLPNF